jgi:putative DNA primase/helicase
MDAEALTRALGGRWHGRYGLASCPVTGHGKGLGDRHPSLAISKGVRQAIVVHCHAGCAQADVLLSLAQRGLWGSTQAPASVVARNAVVMSSPPVSAMALRLWNKAGRAEGTPASLYLARRGLAALSAVLRYLPASACPDIPATADGALVAALSDDAGSVRAVQLTYVTEDGQKANAVPVRQTFGSMRGTAVQLRPCQDTLGIAEGVETALSAGLLHQVPVWAVCGRRLGDAPVPATVHRVIFFADHDSPGLSAAEDARLKMMAQGLDVSICVPPIAGQDWNDVQRALKES